MSAATDPVSFGTPSMAPVLILLPNSFPNAVSPGETLESVLARINAYRAPNRQIVGATDPTTGRPIPLSTPITNRLVAQEVVLNQYLQMGPAQYEAEQRARCGLKSDDRPPA
jgi:hypothetical protein